MSLHPLAGKSAPYDMLVNVPRLISAYYSGEPDPSDPAQRVAFGTSGHRGSSFKNSFNEDHILAISQAICEFRQAQGITGPLFIGMDTHALSEPALVSAIEVFAANEQEIMIDDRDGYTPTPVISHAILKYNRGRTSGLADGVVITPSHNPPEGQIVGQPGGELAKGVFVVGDGVVTEVARPAGQLEADDALGKCEFAHTVFPPVVCFLGR